MTDLSKDPPAAFDRVIHPTLRRQFSGVDAAGDDRPTAARSQELLSGDRMCRGAAGKTKHDPAPGPSPPFRDSIQLADPEGEGAFGPENLNRLEGPRHQ